MILLTAILLGCAGPVEDSCADTGCTDTNDTAVDTSDTSIQIDTDTSYDGETEIDDIDWSCNAGSFQFDVEITGPSLGADLYMTLNTASPWHEYHFIPALETDPDLYWTNLGLSLESIYPDFHEVVEGVSTGYGCSEHQSSLVFMIDVLDENREYAACGVFGVDPNIFRNECSDVWN